MIEEIDVPEDHTETDKRIVVSPHGIAMIVMWLLTTGLLVFMLSDGVRNTGRFRVERYILQTGYVLTLYWYLIRTGPTLRQLPDLPPIIFPKRRIGRLLPVILIAMVLVSEFYDQGILMPLLMFATIWILIVWRREIGIKAVFIGLALTTIAYLGGLPWIQNQYFETEIFFIFLAFVPPMFVAGNLLAKRTALTGSQLYIGQYRKAGMSFVWGCILFVPLGLSNAAAGSPGSYMTWVDRWWIPWSQPFFSGIVEEVLNRLLLVSLCYLLLRPAFNRRPAMALVGAVLFSGITHGLGHGGTLLENFLITGLLYSVPMAVVFARRDWEYAVGAHYMINMIPTLMVYLET